MKQLLKKPCRKNLLNASIEFNNKTRQKENFSSKLERKINKSRAKKNSRMTTQKYSWQANSIRVSIKSE